VSAERCNQAVLVYSMPVIRCAVFLQDSVVNAAFTANMNAMFTAKQGVVKHQTSSRTSGSVSAVNTPDPRYLVR